MKMRKLRKLLRSRGRRNVPGDLRERLVNGIPADFSRPAVEPVRDGGNVFIRRKYEVACAAVAVVIVVALLHFTTGEEGPFNLDFPGFEGKRSVLNIGLVSEAFADVIRNLENAGAFAIEMEVRTGRHEPFTHVAPGRPFSRVKLWLELPSERFAAGRMRTENEVRRTVFDGESTLYYDIEGGESKIWNSGKIDERLASPARWLREYLPIAETAVSVDTILEKGVPTVSLTIREKGDELESGFEPAFFNEFDRRTVFSWEAGTNLLTGLEKFVTHDGGEVPVARLRSIEYYDYLDNGVFSFDLPEGIRPMTAAERDDPRYAELDPVEVAGLIFQGWKDRNWDGVRIFCESEGAIDWMKEHALLDYRITDEPKRRNPDYPSIGVPYELLVRKGSGDEGRKRHYLWLRNDNEMNRYVYDGGL